jgi:hypothetical protein
MTTMSYALATITEDNLIAILSDPQQRSSLQKAIDEEQGSYLPLTNRYADLARTCRATPEQLHAVIKALLPFRRRYRELLCMLVPHPNISAQTLFMLYEKRCCISALGHRIGPQDLLERLATEYRYSEAITTLALHYYSRPEYPTDAFTAFLQEHADDSMLRGNIVRRTGLPTDKQEAIQRVFGASDERSRI